MSGWDPQASLLDPEELALRIPTPIEERSDDAHEWSSSDAHSSRSASSSPGKSPRNHPLPFDTRTPSVDKPSFAPTTPDGTEVEEKKVLAADEEPAEGEQPTSPAPTDPSQPDDDAYADDELMNSPGDEPLLRPDEAAERRLLARRSRWRRLLSRSVKANGCVSTYGTSRIGVRLWEVKETAARLKILSLSW